MHPCLGNLKVRIVNDMSGRGRLTHSLRQLIAVSRSWTRASQLGLQSSIVEQQHWQSSIDNRAAVRRGGVGRGSLVLDGVTEVVQLVLCVEEVLCHMMT